MKPEKWRTRRKRPLLLVSLAYHVMLWTSVIGGGDLCARHVEQYIAEQESSGRVEVTHPWMALEEKRGEDIFNLGYIPGVMYQVTIPVPSEEAVEGVIVRSVLRGNETVGFGELVSGHHSRKCDDGAIVIVPDNGTKAVTLDWYSPPNASSYKSNCVSISSAVINILGNSATNLIPYRFCERQKICPKGDRENKRRCYEYEYLTSSSGVITTPGFPQAYPNNFYLTYFIQVPPNRRIYLQFQFLKLENRDENYCYDSVQVKQRDGGIGENSSYVGLVNKIDYLQSQNYCGVFSGANLSNLAFVSDGNFMVVKFLSDGKVSNSGFRAIYYAVNANGSYTGCRDVLTADSHYKTLQSENYTGQYLPNMACQYDITSAENGSHVVVVISFLDLQRKDNDACSDYLRISGAEYSGPTDLCGHMTDYTSSQLTFTSKRGVLVEFISDALYQGAGYVIKYRSVPSCQDVTLEDNNGTLSSPNYPGYYLHNQDCEMTVSTTEAYSVIQVEMELHTEGPYRGRGRRECTRDWVEVDDGLGSTRYCGDWSDSGISATSVGAALTISFVSDSENSYPGFSANWQVRLNDSSLIPCPAGWNGTTRYCYLINTTSQVNWEEASAHCQKIGARLATLIGRDQQEFLTQITGKLDSGLWIGATDKDYEGVFFWEDGSRVNYTNWFPGWKSHGYFNKQPSDDGLSDSDCVEMRSMFALPYKGEQEAEELYWNDRPCSATNGFICQNLKPGLFAEPPPVRYHKCSYSVTLSLDQTEGVFTSYGYPNPYKNFLQCNLTITAQPGYAIQLDFQEFILEDSHNDGCEYDYLQISSSGNSTRFCGDYSGSEKLLHQVINASNVMLNFVTDHSLTYRGFALRYSIVLEPPGCDPAKGWRRFPGVCYLMPGGHQRATQTKDMAEARKECRAMNATLLSQSQLNSSSILSLFDELMTSVSSDEFFLWVENLASEEQHDWSDFNISGISSTETAPGTSVPITTCSLVTLSRHRPVAITTGVNCSRMISYMCVKTLPEATRAQTIILEGGNGSVRYPGDTSSTTYTNNLDISWVIKAPPRHRIFIILHSLDLEYQRECRYDHLTIWETLADGANNLVARVCGRKNNSSTYAISVNESRVRFISDYSTGGAGFSFRWSSVEIAEVYEFSGQSGAIESINHGGGYLANLDYNISVRAPSSGRVWLQFEYLELNRALVDCSDYISVILGEEMGDIVQLCASNTNNRTLLNFLSRGGAMYLRFHSDQRGTSRGFRATYTSVPETGYTDDSTVRLIPDDSLVVATANFPSSFPGEFRQNIRVRAPLGFQIHVRTLAVTLKDDNNNCSSEKLNIVNEKTPESERGTYWRENSLCRAISSPPSVTLVSYLNTLKVQLHPGNQTQFLGARILLTAKKDPEFVNKTRFDLDGTLDSCEPDTCQNGAECAAVNSSGFICQCTGHYAGVLCAWKHCERETCYNGGGCGLVGDTDYNCTCAQGFAGRRCEMELTECASESCSGRGTCDVSPLDHSVTCICHDGFTGTSCSSIARAQSKSARMRLLEEPFWIGIIVVLGVLAITGVVVFIRRKCATHFDIECCQPTLKKSTVDDKMDTPCNDRRWSLQLPDGYSNFGYSSNEGTPRSKRQEDIQPNGPIINVTNTDEIDAEIKTEADVEAGYRNGYMTSGHMTRKAEEIMVEDEEEMNAYRVTEEGCLHLVDGESGVRSFPEVPVIHLHRAASARGREKQPQDRLALRRCYSSDAKLSEDSDDSAGETVKGRRASTTFPGAVTLGDGQTLNVVAYDGPVIPGYAEGEGKWVDTLKAPGRGRPDTEMDGSDSPMICHKRVNSAQRRKDFANSVRRAREITHVLLDGNNPSCHSPNSSWGSSRGCRTCGGSPFSSKDWHDSRPVVRHPSCTRSFDGVCTCVGKRHRRSRGCSVCSDASYDRSPLGSQMAGTIESGSSGYHSRHSSYQHTSHNTSHASRHSRHRRRESSEGRSASVSSSRRHSHHHHRHHHHHNQPHHLGNEPLQPRSHHSSQHSRDSNERPDSRLSIRSESRLSLGHAHRRRRHRHSRSSGSQGGGGGSDRHSPRRSGTAPDTRSVSVDYGSGDIGELHRMLSATLSNSCGRLERAEHDKLRESIRSSSSQHHDRKSRRKHDRHRHDRHRDREERRKGESRHVREHRHRERRYSRDASPPPADEESSMYKVSGYPVVPPGGHRSLSRTQSGDWQLVDGRLVMYVSGHVSGHVNGHARLAPTRSDTSTDSRLSVPETGPVRRVRSHTPLQKSKSMDIRPKEPGKGWLPGHPQLTSSLSSGSVDTPYSLSRRGSLLSRAESQLGQPRPLLLVPHQDSQLFSDPDSLGGTSSENSGSKAEHEALESSSGVSTDVHTASTSNTSRDVPGDVLPEDTDQQPNGAGWVSIPSIDLNSFLSPDSAGGLDKNSLPLHRHSQQLRTREGEEGRDGPQPQQGGEESPNKHPLRDSAYQSKEQSTEKCNSRPNSTAVSPTFSNGQEQLYARYKAALQNGPEDKRVTSQLELAAKKLTMYGIDERGTEDAEAETELGGPSESESMQVQGMDQPSISGTLSFFFHNAHCLTHSKPRRLFPTRMLSMIADEESELESPALSPHRTSHNPTPELKSPPPSPMDPPTLGTRHRPPASPTAVLELAVLDTTTSDDASDDRSEETCFSQQTEECVRVEVDLEDVTGKDSATDV